MLGNLLPVGALEVGTTKVGIVTAFGPRMLTNIPTEKLGFHFSIEVSLHLLGDKLATDILTVFGGKAVSA